MSSMFDQVSVMRVRPNERLTKPIKIMFHSPVREGTMTITIKPDGPADSTKHTVTYRLDGKRIPADPPTHYDNLDDAMHCAYNDMRIWATK